jgi:hypothetical protein
MIDEGKYYIPVLEVPGYNTPEYNASRKVEC